MRMAAQYELLKELLNSGTTLNFEQEFFFKFYQAFILNDRWTQYIKGVSTTLLVTAIALALGIVLGSVVALVRVAHDQQRPGHKNPVLGFFNILFAWLGLLCFFIPLVIAFAGGDKGYCNRFCGRGQLFSLLGGRFGLSRRADIPRWMKSRAFRYGFLGFFLLMFFQMLWSTYLVFAGAQELRQAVTLLWTFRLPWHWAYYGTLFSPGVAQFAFGFYSVMLTSTVLGLVTMVLFKPRSWCVYCPMGTMTQLICRGKHRGEAALHSPAEGS